MALFAEVLDFLDRSHIRQVRFLGGEPTLHPHFNQFIDQALAKKMPILLFSNGMIPEPVLSKLESMSVEQITVVMNMVAPKETNSRAGTSQRQALQRLGEKVILGLNLYAPSVHLDFLLALHQEFTLAGTIRLGLAHPRLLGSNAYLKPSFYLEIGRRIMDFYRQTCARGIKLELDCGFVPCMFRNDDPGELKSFLQDVRFHCNPILDILPDGRVISCYPLASFTSAQLSPTLDAFQLREEFTGRLRPYEAIGIFKECQTCLLRRENFCGGGCRSLAMKRLRSHPVEKSC